MNYICNKCKAIHSTETDALKCCGDISKITDQAKQQCYDILDAIKRVLRQSEQHMYNPREVKMELRDNVVKYIFRNDMANGCSSVNWISVHVLYPKINNVLKYIGVCNYAISIVVRAKTAEIERSLLK